MNITVKAKTLLIDVNNIHANPTENLYPKLWQNIVNRLDYYGPGYSSLDSLKNGVLNHIAHYGPYEIVVIGSSVPVFSDSEFENTNVAKDMINYKSGPKDLSVLCEFFNDIQRNIKNIEARLKVLSLVNFDYYAGQEKQVEFIINNDLICICPSNQFCTKIENLPEYVQFERHYQKKKNRLGNHWYDFTLHNRDRIITSNHIIGENEFFFSSLKDREYDINVPGIEYYQRKKVLQVLKQSKFSVASKNYMKFFLALGKLHVPVLSSPWGIKLYNEFYQQTLRSSKISYASTGGFGTPVRKFFEIPAMGSFLICDPPSGFENLGFKEGVNYFKADFKNICEVAENFLKDLEKTQLYANSARNCVYSTHSLAARSSQVMACIKSMLSYRYLSSDWEGGKYIIREKNEL